MPVKGCDECLIGWKPPPHECNKINIDRAVRGSDVHVAAGGILRDAIEAWKGGFSKNIGRSSMVQAEL